MPMKRRLLLSLLLVSMLPLTLSLNAYARGNDFAISDGQGEMLQIKNPLFGRKVRVVKDRLGDGFAQQKGILGGADAEYSVLGNRVQRHKGILGNTETSANTIFGDKFVSKKGIFGRRKTAIDISGSSGFIKSLMGHPNANAGPGFPSFNGAASNLAPPVAPPASSTLPAGN